MRPTLTADQVRLLRLRAQRLVPTQADPVPDVASVARTLCGIQAQDIAAATLAVRPRAANLLARDVNRARVEQRSVVRTWAMRGTLHLLAAEDLAWMLPLLGPVFTAGSRGRRADLGLDQDTTVRGVRALREALASRGPLTRAEIRTHLAPQGFRLEGQAAIHLIGHAALEGLVCQGPDRDGEPTYVLLQDWIQPGQPLPPHEALADLVRRYLEAYAPTTPEDLAAWSGLPLGRARAGWSALRPKAIEVDAAGQPAWMLAHQTAWLDEPPPAAPIVRLLPSYDTYLLGYRGRDLAVAPQHARRVHPGGGLLRPVVLVNECAAGAWRNRRVRNGSEVTVEPFQAFSPDVRAGLDAEIQDLARFLGTTVSAQLTASGTPRSSTG